MLAAAGGPSLPTGALTGLIGGPLLIWLLPRMRAQVPQRTEAGDRRSHRAPRPGRLLAGLAAACALLAVLTLLGGRGPQGWGFIAPELRQTFLPLRATAILAAASAGALLAGAGAILQRLTANPMAAPEGAAPWMLALGTSAGGALALAGFAMRADLAPARLLLAGLATGAATMLVGPVSFVGLMAPHLARAMGLARAVPFCAGAWLLGALLMLLAAFGARTASYPYDLPLGLFATLVGTPWLFVLLMKRTAA